MQIMRPHSFHAHGHKIVFPCYWQPKLNGIRCQASKTEDGIVFRSRTGKDFKHLYKHTEMLADLNKLMKLGDVWDGELFVWGWSLQEIVSALTAYSDRTLQLQLHVFDIVTEDTFETRRKTLTLLGRHYTKYVLPVVDGICTDAAHAEELLQLTTSKCEGIILRNKSGLYVDRKTYDVQKYKNFVDDEFEIVGVKPCSKGGAILICATKAGNTFSVKPKGTVADRIRIIEDYDHVVGKFLTVKYLELSAKGIPQIPTGIIIRDYE